MVEHTYGGYRLRVLAPEELAPRWWELLRRLGLRRRRRRQRVKAGHFLVVPGTKTLYTRPEDYARIMEARAFRIGGPAAVDLVPRLEPEHIVDACHRLRLPPPSRI